MAKVLQSRKGSPTMEYIIVIACGVALALLLNQVMAFAEVQGALKDKIIQVLTGQNMVASVDESPKEQSIEERKDDLFGRPQWVNDLTSGYQSLKSKFKKGLSEAWENVKNKDLGEVTQSLWNNTTNALDSAWQWAKENKEVVASAGVIIAGVSLLLIPGMEPLGLMLLANWGLSLGFGALLNGGEVDKTVLLGAAIGGAAGAIGGGAAGAFFSGLTKFAPGLGTAITGSRFLGPIISGGKQILGKAPAFVQRMAGGLFSKMGAMTATEGAITSGVDDWLRGKELNWKRAVLSGLAGATLVGFASGTYQLVQPLINKATAAIEKHAGPVVAKIRPTIQNVDKCFGYQQTLRFFALIKFGNGNFIECLYAQADRGGGGNDTTSKKLVAGTADHKAQRWKEYKESGGDWDYERWSKVYDLNMERARNANKAMDNFHKKLGWGEREVTVIADGHTRRLDIADKALRKGIEHKTRAVSDGSGYFSLSKEIKWEVERDAYLVDEEDWDITWVFENAEASEPLKDALNKAGIKIKFIEKGGSISDEK
jgi:hypothetical protein